DVVCGVGDLGPLPACVDGACQCVRTTGSDTCRPGGDGLACFDGGCGTCPDDAACDPNGCCDPDGGSCVARRWALLAAAGGFPAQRASAVAVYDPVGERAILFGGEATDGSGWLGDTWLLDLRRDPPAWTELLPNGAPTP